VQYDSLLNNSSNPFSTRCVTRESSSAPTKYRKDRLRTDVHDQYVNNKCFFKTSAPMSDLFKAMLVKTQMLCLYRLANCLSAPWDPKQDLPG